MMSRSLLLSSYSFHVDGHGDTHEGHEGRGPDCNPCLLCLLTSNPVPPRSKRRSLSTNACVDWDNGWKVAVIVVAAVRSRTVISGRGCANPSRNSRGAPKTWGGRDALWMEDWLRRAHAHLPLHHEFMMRSGFLYSRKERKIGRNEVKKWQKEGRVETEWIFHAIIHFHLGKKGDFKSKA